MTKITRTPKFDEMLQTLIVDGKLRESKLIKKFGLINAKTKLNEVLSVGLEHQLLTIEEIRELKNFKTRIEYDLRYQNKTKQDYKDADEFLNSFLEPSRIDVLTVRCNELYYAVNWLAARLNNRPPLEE